MGYMLRLLSSHLQALKEYRSNLQEYRSNLQGSQVQYFFHAVLVKVNSHTCIAGLVRPLSYSISTPFSYQFLEMCVESFTHTHTHTHRYMYVYTLKLQYLVLYVKIIL
jgi:hypothetical protein